jgi:hypothetical protein
MEPNFIVIGAMKAGTTSIWAFLRQHPAVFMPEIKEIDYFSASWDKGWTWYQSNFASVGPNVTAIGEASTTYSRHPWFPETASRLARSLPSAQLIYCLRDPLKRIQSMYVHCVHMGHERRSFEDAMQYLSVDVNDYVAMSAYHYQLQKYLRYFPLNQVYFVILEKLQRNPALVLKNLCHYIHIDNTYEFDVSIIRNESSRMRRQKTSLGNTLSNMSLEGSMIRRMPGRLQRLYRHLTTKPIEKPLISAETKNRLIEILQPDTDALRSLTGLHLTDWQI